MGDSQKRSNSMCAVYAEIIRAQIRSENPDQEAIEQMCENIERYCQTVGFEPGEVPEHLEDHLFDGE